MPDPNPKSNPLTLPEFYAELGGLDCKFIPLRDHDKLPAGHWQDAPGLTIDEAIPVLGGMDNPGIVPGPRVVLADIDNEQAHAVFQAAFPGLPPTTETPRGWHYWLACPADMTIGELGIEQGAGQTSLGAGIDTRTPGKGYGVGPGSVLNDKAYGKNPPPGGIDGISGREWHYKLTGPIHYVSAEALAVLRKPAAKPKATRKRAKPKPEVIDIATRQALPPAETGGTLVAHGNRHDVALRAAWQMAHNMAISEQAIIDLLHEFRERHFERQPNGEPYADDIDREKVAKGIAKIDKSRDPDLGERAAVYFSYSAENERRSFKNMLTAGGVEVGYNIFTEVPEIKRNGEAWRRVQKGEINSLRTELPSRVHAKPDMERDPDGGGVVLTFPKLSGGRGQQLTAGWKLSAPDFDSHLSGVTWADRRDPVALRLAEIESKYRDANNITGSFLMDAWRAWFDAEGRYQEPAEFMLPLLACGIVIRNLIKPGAMHPMAPALIGKPGIGKSTMLRCIPFDPDTQFRDDYRFAKGGVEAAQAHGQQYIGILVIELAEMEAFRRADQEAVQAAFSRQQVNFRRAWGRESNDPYLLRCVMAITSNLDDVIVKPAGVENRRILPVKLTAKFAGRENSDRVRESWTPEFRELIFAHAIHLVRSGKWDAMINPIEAAMKRLTPDHVRVDEVMAEALNESLKTFSIAEQEAGLTRKQILDAMGYPTPRNAETRFAGAIRDLDPPFDGPHPTTRDGEKVRLWKRERA